MVKIQRLLEQHGVRCNNFDKRIFTQVMNNGTKRRRIRDLETKLTNSTKTQLVVTRKFDACPTYSTARSWKSSRALRKATKSDVSAKYDVISWGGRKGNDRDYGQRRGGGPLLCRHAAEAFFGLAISKTWMAASASSFSGRAPSPGFLPAMRSRSLGPQLHSLSGLVESFDYLEREL